MIKTSRFQLFLVIFISLGPLALVGQTVDEVLRQIQTPVNVHIPLTLTYKFTRQVSKFKGNEEELQQLLANDFASLSSSSTGPDSVERQKMLEQFRRDDEERLKDGSSETCMGRAYLSDEFRAVAEKSLDIGRTKWDWSMQKGDVRIEYSEFNESARIMMENRRETQLSLFMRTAGLLGNMPSWLDQQKERSMSSASTPGSQEIKLGPFLVKTFVFGGKLVVGTIAVPYSSQRDGYSLEFKEYKDYSGITIPSVVVQTVTSRQFDVVCTYSIEAAQQVPKLTSVPFLNKETGIVHIVDERFKKPIVYYVKDRLPEDNQLAEWLSDPEALRQYNKTMMSLRH